VKHRVLADEPLPDDILRRLEGAYSVDVWLPEQSADLATYVALITYGHPPIDGPFMDRMSQLRMISNFGVGVDHIDLAAAKERGIPVGYTPNLMNGAAADMTFALLLAAARNLVVGDGYARGPEYLHLDPRILIGQEVHGATLGIIGLGNIGFEVARRARGFDMTILYHNRHTSADAESKLGVRYADLPELLVQSDFVVLTVPLTEATRHLISRAELAQMKTTAILINIARGGVVDTDALLHALQTGQIAAAALDVTEPEPLPRDHPLLKQANLVLTPHLGSAAGATRLAMGKMTVDNLEAGLADRELLQQAI
jgi:glyoxylate reductase